MYPESRLFVYFLDELCIDNIDSRMFLLDLNFNFSHIKTSPDVNWAMEYRSKFLFYLPKKHEIPAIFVFLEQKIATGFCIMLLLKATIPSSCNN